MFIVYVSVYLISLQEKNKVMEVFDYCMEVFKDDLNYTNEIRQKTIERLCLPLLEYITSKSLEEFFKKHIKFFVQSLEEKFNKYVESEFETQLINKICCYKMIAMMYQKLNKDDFTSPTSEIVLAFIPNPVTGKELTSALSK